MNIVCPDCFMALIRRPRLKQDGRCKPCRRTLKSRDDRRAEKARARRARVEDKLADSFV